MKSLDRFDKDSGPETHEILRNAMRSIRGPAVEGQEIRKRAQEAFVGVDDADKIAALGFKVSTEGTKEEFQIVISKESDSDMHGGRQVIIKCEKDFPPQILIQEGGSTVKDYALPESVVEAQRKIREVLEKELGIVF